MAVNDAQEFCEIGDALPPERLEPLIADLQRALGGTYELGAGPGALRALQHQTQIWVGAMLAHANIPVYVPTPSADPRPDVVVSNGTRQYALEVKRPQGNRDASSLVSDAARQLRNRGFHGEAVLVDLSDCIEDATAGVYSRGVADLDSAKQELDRLTLRLHDEVYSERTRRLIDGRQHIFTIAAFARLFRWDLDDLSEARPSRYFKGAIYWRGQRYTLRHHCAQWLATLLQIGLASAGYEELSSNGLAIPRGGTHGSSYGAPFVKSLDPGA